MDVSNESVNESKDNTSALQEHNATECEFQTSMNDEDEDEDDYDYEDSDNNDNEKCGEDILLALSEEQNDFPVSLNENGASSSSLFKKSQTSGMGLGGGLDILNLNSQLSKLGVPGTSKGTNTDASTCLFLNNIYQALLSENLIKVQQKLAENQEKQKILIGRIKQSKLDANKIRKNVFCVPYFHKNNKMPQPNDHTKILQSWHYDKILKEKPWTANDHDILMEAIHENAWEITLKPFLQRIEIYTVKMATTEDEEEKEELEQKIKDTKFDLDIALEGNIETVAKDIDENKFDWMKISNLSFRGKHSEFSCYLMWKNWLNPRVNKSSWNQTETEKLQSLVDLHGRNQWKLIAKELGTNRTPFHCLQHYRRKLDIQVKREWTDEEDKILKEVLDTCRFGKQVPWNQVSFYMEGRSSESCRKRWAFLNPELKHGRWGKDEDSLLVAGVNMIGIKNWALVKQFVPGRTSTQCRERWYGALDPRINSGRFSYDEDKILYKFVKEHGHNWASLLPLLPGRTDNQCQKQYNRLQRWETQAKYVEEQNSESKTYFLHNFNAKHYANLVEKNKTIDELFPYCEDSTENDVETIWQNQQQMLKRDLVQQEIDRRKGEIFPPRPQLVRRFQNPTLIKMWEQRKRMQQSIEDLVQKTTKKSPQKCLKNTTLSQKLDNLKPNMTVMEMVKIAQRVSAEIKPAKHSNKRLCSFVDQKIKSLLYLDWLKEEMKDQPKLSINKSEATCEAEKSMDRLEGMTLMMKVLGMDHPNILKKILFGANHNTLMKNLTNYMNADELQKFKEEFLLISENPQPNGNYSGNQTPKVQYSDNIPPNLHTLSAFRLLLIDTKKLQKTADNYQFCNTKSDETSADEDEQEFQTLSEKMKIIKETYWYKMLENHFRSLFMWPVMLSTLNGVCRNVEVSQPFLQKRKNTKYPLCRKRRKVCSSTAGSSKKKKKASATSCEESNNSSDAATSVIGSPPAADPTLTKKRLGRPFGSYTKHKVADSTPQRTSSRERKKKSPFDADLLLTTYRTLKKKTPCTNNKKRPNAKKAKRDDHEASTVDNSLLANVSPTLVQQVISQEVQVKQIGTYVTVPITMKTE